MKMMREKSTTYHGNFRKSEEGRFEKQIYFDNSSQKLILHI